MYICNDWAVGLWGCAVALLGWLMGCGFVGLLGCWVVGWLGFWGLACWVVELLGGWVVGLLGSWVVGLLSCWFVELLGCWPGRALFEKRAKIAVRGPVLGPKIAKNSFHKPYKGVWKPFGTREGTQMAPKTTFPRRSHQIWLVLGSPVGPQNRRKTGPEPKTRVRRRRWN